MRFLPLLFTLLGLTLSLPALADNTLNLTPAQQAELERFAPGVELTPELADKLRAIAFDQSRSLDDRITAMQKVAGFTRVSRSSAASVSGILPAVRAQSSRPPRTSAPACYVTAWIWIFSPTPAKAWWRKT